MKEAALSRSSIVKKQHEGKEKLLDRGRLWG
jgi:hypothetical protein